MPHCARRLLLRRHTSLRRPRTRSRFNQPLAETNRSACGYSRARYRGMHLSAVHTNAIDTDNEHAGNGHARGVRDYGTRTGGVRRAGGHLWQPTRAWHRHLLPYSLSDRGRKRRMRPSPVVRGTTALHREGVLLPRVYSHSMVPGGFDVTSSTTRLTSLTSLVMRVEIFSSTS